MMEAFDKFMKGYKNYAAYLITLAAFLALYLCEGLDLKEVTALGGALSVFFGLFARKAQGAQ